MANPLRDFFLGTVSPRRNDLVQALEPRRTFADVILPVATRRALDFALQQIKKHDLIFHNWGLGERHGSGTGLAFNFAGPPGTGKTICAEAIAHTLGKKLLLVRYSEMESLWSGETGKNVTAVFASAVEQDAVLLFDEADAIAGRRFSEVTQGYQREANTVVNVLLKELENFDGVVIFATNLAANFDPAFERRIRTHILFELPGPHERAQIWQVQLHARKTPLDADVDFTVLGERFAASGGDIKNAVLKAAQLATLEPGPDAAKRIAQRHFEAGMLDVLAARKVMEQSLFEGEGGEGGEGGAGPWLAGGLAATTELAQAHGLLEITVSGALARLGELEQHSRALPGQIEAGAQEARSAQAALRRDMTEALQGATEAVARHTESWNQEVTKLNDSQESLAAGAAQNTASLAQLSDRIEKLQATVDARANDTRTIVTDVTARLEHRLRFFQIVTIAMLCLLSGFVIYLIAQARH